MELIVLLSVVCGVHAGFRWERIDSYDKASRKAQPADFVVFEEAENRDGCNMNGFWKPETAPMRMISLYPANPSFPENCDTMHFKGLRLIRWYFAPQEFLDDSYKIPHPSEMDCAQSSRKSVTLLNVSIRHRDSKLCPLDLETARFHEKVIAQSIFIDFGNFLNWLACCLHDFVHIACFLMALYVVNNDAPRTQLALTYVSWALIAAVVPMLLFFYLDPFTTLYWYDIDPQRLFAASALLMKGLYVSINTFGINTLIPENVRLSVMKALAIGCIFCVPVNTYKMLQMGLYTNYQTMFWYMIISVLLPVGAMLLGIWETLFLTTLTDRDVKWLIWRGFVLLPVSLYTMAMFYRVRIIPGETLYFLPALAIQATAFYFALRANPLQKRKED